MTNATLLMKDTQPEPQKFQGYLTFSGLIAMCLAWLGNKLGLKLDPSKIDGAFSFIAANWTDITAIAGAAITFYGRVRINWRSSTALFLLSALSSILLSSCSGLKPDPFDDALAQMMTTSVIQSDHRQSMAEINAAQDQRVIAMEQKLIRQIQDDRSRKEVKRDASPTFQLPRLAPMNAGN